MAYRGRDRSRSRDRRDRSRDRGGFGGGSRGGYGGGGGSYGGGSSYGGGGGSFGGGSFGGGGFGGDRMGQLGAGLRDMNYSGQSLTPIQKNFYKEHPEVKSMSEDDVRAIRKKHEISIVVGEPIRPICTFEQACFPDYMTRELYNAGFKLPSPIQIQGWPIAMSGRDMIGIADTGSGKTVAFLMPALVHINAQQSLQRGDGPIVLVLAPTRELAVQIQGECSKFGHSSRIKNSCCYGGAPRGGQVRDLRNGVEILIATPGRLIDFLESGVTNLKRVTYFVMDEADRMLDMGFEPQVRKIAGQIRPDRQTLLWSATWPKEVKGLARDLCRNEPTHINIGSFDLKASHNISQFVEIIEPYNKKKRLEELMRSIMDGSKILIFAETKRGCDELTRDMRMGGWPALSIHGDKKQEEREWVLKEFREGRNPILVATDVAARGLDVKDIKHVINYDFPGQIEDYVHRIGRTGRAGAKGNAYTFFTEDKRNVAAALVDILREAKQQVPPRLEEMARFSGRGGGGGKGKGKRRYGGGGGGGFQSGANAIGMGMGMRRF